MPSALQQELKQRKPFQNLRHEVVVNLARTAAVLGHELETELKPFGLTLTQFNVLRMLRGAGEEGLCQYQIRDRLIAQVPDVPRLLARMERAHLIERRRYTTDKRVVLSFITEGGLVLLATIDVIIERLLQQIFQGISDPQLQELNRLLDLARKK